MGCSAVRKGRTIVVLLGMSQFSCFTPPETWVPEEKMGSRNSFELVTYNGQDLKILRMYKIWFKKKKKGPCFYIKIL